MSQSTEKVYEAALELSREDLEDLVDRLELALDEEPEGTKEEIAAAWNEELARRSAQVEAGEVELIPWEDVEREAQKVISKHRKK